MDKKVYEQVIEWEYIDELTSNNSELAIAILLYIVNDLEGRQEFHTLYKFTVISFGWLGFYPAVGVQYLRDNLCQIEEDYIYEEFYKIVKQTSLIEFLNFSQSNYEEIKKIKVEILKDNDNR